MAGYSSSTENRSLFSPCAACKFLRRRCLENCLLKPYFPPTEPLQFVVAHKIFGASNIIKLLQELPVTQRADAVNSLIYEANARMRDPIYGSAGVISNLHDQMIKLQAQVALAQAEISNLKSQNANLMTLIHKQNSSPDPFLDSTLFPYDDDNNNCYLGETTWESFWS
ncbi:LOB domain-containing protein 1-like [Solanum dulcamara]|uniref:LOB domain-containing protein 1-like n=1 Tax=Solanum dulcamara TaxID=45834 RepID=UPI0024862A01|nr:LOB domain-containing protein 1-like [Solanum dulcamara]